MLKSSSSHTPIPRIESNLDIQGRSKILVVRPDRLGDVILSTPVFQVIKKHYPGSTLTVLVKEHVAPILKGLDSVDHIMTFDPDYRHSGFKGFLRLCTEIRRQQFKIAVVLQSHWKIALALFLARVRYRVGPLSKFHSFLLYNRGLRQRRSHVEMHETDYNLQLLRKLGIRVGSRIVPTQVHIAESVRNSAEEWLRQQGWDSTRSLILVHPGMGGSALNWPESHYTDLIQRLLADGQQILLTGGPTEGGLLDRIKGTLGPLGEKPFYYKSNKESSINFLGALCSFAQLVIAPSTGPLHLAVAVGRPVLTFYPPVRVQSAIRWGPYLMDETRASVLVPEVYCGQDFECLGHLCNYFPCMKSLTVKQALVQVNQHLASAKQQAEILPQAATNTQAVQEPEKK